MRNRCPGRFVSKSIPLVAVVLGILLSGCEGYGPGSRESILVDLILAEDARGAGPEGLGPIEEALGEPDADLQLRAVRALGRLEDPGQIDAIAGLLSAVDPLVRAEAVNALGQAVFGGEDDGVGALILERLPGESDPEVRGVMGRTLGRLRYADPGGVRNAEAALLHLTLDGERDAALPSLLGGTMGLESLTRQNRGAGLTERTTGRLEELATYGLSEAGPSQEGPEGGRDGQLVDDAARVRRVALMALTSASADAEDVFYEAMADPDPDVRRLALAAIGRFEPSERAVETLEASLHDPAPRVRMEAVPAFAAQAPPDQKCLGLLEAASDEHPLVAVAALDLLNRPCPELDRQTESLMGFIQSSDASTADGWHRGAHALVALADLDPGAAAPFIPEFAGHDSPFARAYGAQAAALAGNQAVLGWLALDPAPNVRTAAVRGLAQLSGHDADETLLSQLTQDDPQLLITVAGLLEGTPDPGAATHALLQTFQRISARKWETLRDPRMAVLERLGEVVVADVQEDAVQALGPYLFDYDSMVADRVAELLTGWTGEPQNASPEPLAQQVVPTPEELDILSGSRVILEMEGGGGIEIRLFPHLAPTNAARFADLARSGTLDGLTFHRVVANFVLQGGSPGANEMAGHGAYTRDEIGLQPNWRGTVGISTRGRDTGDGQIFINLVDNLRLDHNYTIIGEVVNGMEVVDRVVEGQVIVRVRVEDE